MYLPRSKEKEIVKWMEKGYIVVVKGPRRAGKTTLLKHLKEKTGGTYIDMTDERWAKRFEADPLSFSKLKQPLFIDEIGEVKNAGKALKVLYDSEKPKMVVSGSGAFEVKENIGGKLVGRAVYIELLPLSFKEFLLWKDKEFFSWYFESKKDVDLRVMNEYYEEYVRYGGYPEVFFEEEKEFVIKNIIETQMERDIFRFFDIRDREQFREVMKKLATNVGGILNINSLNISNRTAWRYISSLNMEYILELLSPYHKNLLTEIRKSKKIYFYDMGILNYLSEGRLSKGQERENFVFLSLIDRFGKERIRYWRTQGGAEVDFVVVEKGKPILGIEVKSSYKRSRAMMSFLSSYNLDKGIIVSDVRKKVRRGEKEIEYKMPWDILG